MKKTILALAAFILVTAFTLKADNVSIGDQVIVQTGYLLFEDRHKQEDMAGSSAAQIEAAIKNGDCDCIMVSHPVLATIIREVGSQIEIEQDGGMTWWTTKTAVVPVR
jgi:hypothetical protein